MLRVAIVLVVILAALLRGGSLRRFAEVELRALPLVFGGLALQLLIFTPFRDEPLIPFATEAIYLLSMALILAWVWLHRRLPGLWLVLIGVAMNTAAIVANGGYMPVAPLAAEYAGNSANYATEGAPIANNSLAVEEARLWLLTDIFPLPAAIPLANVYSLGDILLTVGASIFCYRAMLDPQALADTRRGAAPAEQAKRAA